MRNQLIVGVVFIVFTVSFTHTAYANKFSFGISAGMTDIGISTLPETNSSFSNGVGGKLFVDYKLTNKISLGAFYARSTEENIYKIGDIEGLAGDIWEFIDEVFYLGLLNPGVYATIDTEVQQYGISAKYFFNFGPAWAATLLAGYSYWQSDISLSVPGEPTVSSSTNGNGYNYGFGIKRIFDNSWALSLDYERSELDDISISASFFSVEWYF